MEGKRSIVAELEGKGEYKWRKEDRRWSGIERDPADCLSSGRQSNLLRVHVQGGKFRAGWGGFAEAPDGDGTRM